VFLLPVADIHVHLLDHLKYHPSHPPSMFLLGVDEAGKGPVIGFMFVAGIVIDEERLFEVAGMGVKDSKLLSPERRGTLAGRLVSLAEDHYILEVPPRVIDELRGIMTMNEIMVRSFSQVLRRLKADKAILDAADVNASRFAERVRIVSGTSMEVVAEHQADAKHLVVGAASILAKVRRDRSMRELEASLGRRIGSGYPADPDTIAFLGRWVQEHGELPDFARHTWATALRIKALYSPSEK
jgi:ribonuclease HII